MPKTFSDAYDLYNEMYKRSQEDYAKFTQTPEFIAYRMQRPPYTAEKPKKDMPPYEGFQINYSEVSKAIYDAILAEGFTEAQAAYILCHAEQEKHSHYSDVIGYASELCDFIKKFPKGK